MCKHLQLAYKTISARNISARVISAQMFQHRDISAFAPYCFARRQNIHMSKCSGAQISKYEIFLCQKFLGLKIFRAKNSPCRNVLMLKCPSRSLCTAAASLAGRGVFTSDEVRLWPSRRCPFGRVENTNYPMHFHSFA